MNEIPFVEHDAHVIALPDLEEDEVSRQNFRPGYFITGSVQLFGGDRDLQAGLFVHVVNESAAVEGVRAFGPAPVGLPEEGHRLTDDLFPDLAARLVEGDLLDTAGQESKEGEEYERLSYQFARNMLPTCSKDPSVTT